MPSEAGPPRVFLSYSHDSERHKQQVLALADRLRGGGIDARVDQYEMAPPEGWPRWMERQIVRARFVLVVCTETYKRRFLARERLGSGRGATWEGAVITQELYDAQGRNEKFIPVVLAAGDESHLPIVLRGTTCYHLDRTDGYDELYRRLTGQPATPMPALGPLKPMPPLRPGAELVNRESPTTPDPEIDEPSEPSSPESSAPGAQRSTVPEWLSWSIRHYQGILAFAAVLPIAVYALGLFAHASRESLLGLEQRLSYPKEQLILVGLDVPWALAWNAISVLFSSQIELSLGAWSALAALVAVWTASRWWPRRRLVTTGLLAATFLPLLVAAAFYTAALFPPRSANAVGPDFHVEPGGNLIQATTFESVSWLANDSALNERRRRDLAGLVLWFVAAAALGAYRTWRLGATARIRWGLATAWGLLLFHLLSLVPRAYAVDRWGLKYPAVEIRAVEGCGDRLRALEAGCCAFDISEGGRPEMLLLRGEGCPSGRGAFVPLAEEMYDCLNYLPGRRVIYHGCG